jgi:hypothetical protein
MNHSMNFNLNPPQDISDVCKKPTIKYQCGISKWIMENCKLSCNNCAGDKVPEKVTPPPPTEAPCVDKIVACKSFGNIEQMCQRNRFLIIIWSSLANLIRSLILKIKYHV